MQRKKLLKWGAGIVLTPILLFIILTILLYLPPVQNWLVQQVTQYASRQTGMEISVQRVRLAFPLDLCVKGFSMSQKNDSLPRRDTIADVKSLMVDVQLWPLLKGNVEVDALEFNDVNLNTADLVSSARVKGRIGRLYLQSHGIDLGKETVRINEAALADAAVSVELSDTVPPDTSTTTNNWKIRVDKLDISKTGVTVHMPGDTLQIAAYMGKTEARGGCFDLSSGLYSVDRLDWTDGRLAYDNNFAQPTDGLDPNHIALTGVTVGLDSVYFRSPDMRLNLRRCAFKEKSGITVESIAGTVSMDSVRLTVPSIRLRTSDSHLTAKMAMDVDAFDDKSPGRLYIDTECAIGKQDIMRFMGGMPTDFVRRWPNRPLTMKAVAAGNMRMLNIGGINIKLPSAFNININGTAGNLTDTDRLTAKVKLDANTYDLGFVNELLRAQGAPVTVPRNIGIRGDIGIDGNRYSADLTATEGGGRIKAKGRIDTKSMKYDASLLAENLRTSHFLAIDSIGDFSGYATVSGSGTNLTSPRTTLTAQAGVDKFSMGTYNLDSISLQADMKGGKAYATLNSDNPLAKGTIALDARMDKKMVRSTLTANVAHTDWYGLHLTESPLATSLRCRVDVGTDLKTMLWVRGMINDLTIEADSGRTYRPDDLRVDVLTSRDTTHFVTECGDFRLHFNGRGGYKKILDKAGEFAQELSAELKNKQIDVPELRKKLPLAQLYLTTGKNNPLSRFIARKGFTFQDADIDISSSPILGLNGNIQLIELQNSAMTLDTVRFNINSDSTNCTYNAQVRNNRKNKQYVFNALLDGYIFGKGSGANIRFYDAQDSLGVKLGVEASMEEHGIKVHMLTDDPILGYKKFKVNNDNFLYMGADRRVSAKLQLTADDGTGVHIYSDDGNTEALQDLTIGLNKFDLEKVLSVVPYMPDITGIMNGDFHIVQTKDALSLSSSMSIDNMTYERSRMGNLSTEFVYMPQSDGTHTLDGVLSCNDEQVAELSGTYRSEESDLDAQLRMTHMPVRLLNGFIPDRIIRLRGYADGELAVQGQLDKPRVNGEIKFDSCYMRSAQYGVKMRWSDKPVRIVGSNLLFEDFKMYANNDNPLTLNGNVDFSDMSNMSMNLNMVARNCQVIDAKENRRSIAFGKAFVDFFATMKGPMERLEMLGRLDVLGSTDMSYILRDTPLSTDNRMDELVKFVNFEDTTATVVEHQPISGFKMDLTLNVAQGAHVMCYLNDDHSNYIDLMGGGSLRMQYGLTGDIRLTGRYTLDNGVMKYSLPVIPLKTFTIQDGSYIEFTGDPMNPKLNITATERTKANVSSGGSSEGRTVEFDCGVVITKTLSDMGLEFTISAPEDMTLNTELQSMSVEQRGKIAVTMLTTGMYLASGNTSKFSMNNALNSFLQSEINNITGSALRSLDLSFGMDNSTDASGGTHTDYSFKFSKRFWNNRIKIVVGGKVSTGPDVANQNESFFDNVTLEYRLGESSDKYLKLYYDNNSYDWLEGTVREYGAGFIWRRSLQHFKEIFSFGKKKKARKETQPADSTKNNKK